MGATHRERRRDHWLIAVAGVAIGAAFAVSPAPAEQFTILVVAFDTLAAGLRRTIDLGLRTAPALAAPILGALAFPLVAYAARAVARSRRSREATKLYRRGLLRAKPAIAGAGDGEGLHGSAFLEVVGGRGGRFAISGDMLRIGREDDNDIRIASGAVHRYHAAISRENLDEWCLTDLSGLDGNGVIVNGRRCAQALLADGDVIQLGPGRLRFRAGSV